MQASKDRDGLNVCHGAEDHVTERLACHRESTARSSRNAPLRNGAIPLDKEPTHARHEAPAEPSELGLGEPQRTMRAGADKNRPAR